MRRTDRRRWKHLIVFLCLGTSLVSAQTEVLWTAYNDCLTNAGPPLANVTDWTIYIGETSKYTGVLKDYATGSTDGMPIVTFSMEVGINASSITGGSGGNASSGTPAYAVFNGIVDFSPNLLGYTSLGWAQEMEFSNLDPGLTYTFIGTAIRTDPYPNRKTLVTISGHDSATNNSSNGLNMVGKTPTTTIFLAGDNDEPGAGDIVRWDEIVPGADGIFKIRAEATSDSDQGRAYAINGFMLQATGTLGNQAPEVDAGTDQEITLPVHSLTLDATVTDDGLGDPNGYLAYQWSQVSGPGEVTFEPDANVEDPTIEFTLNAPGGYVLKLEATDGELSAFDEVNITVHPPDCPIGDVNGDCIVDSRDLQVLGLHWLTNPGEEADINNDNFVDGQDYYWLASNWLENWQTGSLQVYIYPAEALGAGAQWRVDGGDWQNSGVIVPELSIDAHTVEFKTVENWYAPANQNVSVVYGEITQANGTYIQHTGSLQVTISPPDVLPTAQWRRVGQSVWHDSGTKESDVPVGIHHVEFSVVSGWLAPGNIEIEIEKDTLYDLDAAYTPRENISLRINEFMAANNESSGIHDEHGDYDDWIEIYNSTDSAIDIGGMYIADEQDIWQIPTGYSGQTTIPASGYLVLWADAEGDAPENEGVLHLGLIELDADGDEITLYDVDGTTVIDSVNFDNQVVNVSYGRYPDGANTWYYFTDPTEGTSNDQAGLADRVQDTKFTPDRGFYSSPFYVTITTNTPGATIYYTTDYTFPIDSNGDPTPSAQEYDEVTNKPYITTTACLRAAAVKPGLIPTNVDTHTYIFLDDVLQQPTNPVGYPTQWISPTTVTGDYQVDPDIVGPSASTADRLVEADMLSVPTIVVSMEIDKWFDPTIGIYVNESLNYHVPQSKEYVCSFEYMDPEGSGIMLQQSCAIAMAGGVSGGGTSLARWKSYKLSMRPRFKTFTDDGDATGGPPTLQESIFPDSPVNNFDTIVLDAVLNHSWLHPDSGQRDTAKYIQDQCVADLHNAMGGYSPHGAYAHVYINNLYWGMYYIHERPDHAWAAEMFGGAKEEYDAIKHSSTGVINDGVGGAGATSNYNAMLSAAYNATTNPADPDYLSDWQAVESQLDVDNLITYLLANYYSGNHDWAHKNWYATHRVPDGKWRYHSWDAEHTFEWGNDVGDSPSGIHNYLAGHPEYKMRWADHIHKHFHNNGALQHPNPASIYQARMTQIDQAIRGESGRWGDNRQATPYTRTDWLNTQNYLLTNDFPGRTSTLFGWLSSLYPATDPPELNINGTPQYGGYVFSGDTLTMTNPNGSGTIYYTLNGNDPRAIGGAVNTAGGATTYGSPIPLTHSIRVKARVLNGSEWSAVSDVVFAVGNVKENLRITEIMFHPLDPPAGNADAEFIELKNISATETINLALVRFTNGVDLELPYLQLEPGAIAVVVKDQTAFASQYDTGGITIVPDVYVGSLDNGGERIELVDANDQPIHNFRYDDDWYMGTDGEGLSLNIRDPYNPNLNDWDRRGGWKASSVFKGTPGLDDEGVGRGDVVINEVLSHSSGGPDWIELRNLSEEDIDLGGMYLSNSDADDPNLRKFRIPDNTIIYHTGAPSNGEYLVFDENTLGFTLSENGDDVHLTQEVGGVLTNLADENFGASESDVAFGRYVKSALDGGVNFVAMSSNTQGYENAYPKVGPVIINEICYNPDSNGDAEYVELLNISGSTVELSVSGTPDASWRFVDDADDPTPGLEYIFPDTSTITLAAGEYMLLIKDETAFETVFLGGSDISTLGVQWREWGDGSLSNGGEKLELQKPGEPGYYIRVDRVNYSDGVHPEGEDPWPIEPDDSDDYVLERIQETDYGNDVINWQADSPTPGDDNDS